MFTKTRKLLVIRLGMILVLLGGMMSVSPVMPVLADTITVTNTNDSGAGSLRDAITTAGSGDTITFDPGLSGGTIHLASTLILSQDVTIDGSTLASQITISGDDLYRVFNVKPSVTVTLDSLIIAHGKSPYNKMGGGIYNEGGTLSVVDSTISNNSADTGSGVYNASTTINGVGVYGFVTVSGSTFSGNSAQASAGAIYSDGGSVAVSNSTFSNNNAVIYGGGGIHSGGTLTVTNSIFSGNSASGYNSVGGGILSGGTLTVTNSTFSGNGASDGGGIFGGGMTVTESTFSGNNALDSGGGIHNSGVLTVTNSTFSSNTATNYGGGGIANYGTLTVTNSTFSGNSASYGGGISNNTSGMLNLTNTIIANSMSGGDCYTSTTLTTNTNNLVEDGSCAASLSGDPNLAPLADNGGPTQTFALIAGSLAIDAGDDAVCVAAPVNGMDQRGVTRPQATHCDIGHLRGKCLIPFRRVLFPFSAHLPIRLPKQT